MDERTKELLQHLPKIDEMMLLLEKGERLAGVPRELVKETCRSVVEESRGRILRSVCAGDGRQPGWKKTPAEATLPQKNPGERGLYASPRLPAAFLLNTGRQKQRRKESIYAGRGYLATPARRRGELWGKSSGGFSGSGPPRKRRRRFRLRPPAPILSSPDGVAGRSTRMFRRTNCAGRLPSSFRTKQILRLPQGNRQLRVFRLP